MFLFVPIYRYMYMFCYGLAPHKRTHTCAVACRILTRSSFISSTAWSNIFSGSSKELNAAFAYDYLQKQKWNKRDLLLKEELEEILLLTFLSRKEYLTEKTNVSMQSGWFLPASRMTCLNQQRQNVFGSFSIFGIKRVVFSPKYFGNSCTQWAPPISLKGNTQVYKQITVTTCIVSNFLNNTTHGLHSARI